MPLPAFLQLSGIFSFVISSARVYTIIFESRSREEITEEQNFIINIENMRRLLFNVFDYINPFAPGSPRIK